MSVEKKSRHSLFLFSKIIIKEFTTMKINYYAIKILRRRYCLEILRS